jgi:hypothetical protein
MKKLSLIISLLIISHCFSFGQTLVLTKSDLSFVRSDKPQYHSIHLGVKNIKPRQSVYLSVIESNSGTAERGVDYILESPYRKVITDTAIIDVFIAPEKDQKKAKTIIFKIQAMYRGENLPGITDTLTIKPFKAEAAEVKKPRDLAEIDSARFTILTAGSLNFFGNQLFSKYVGQLDIRLPSLLGNDKKWGINVGVFTKNFYADSVYTGMGTFNVQKPGDDVYYARKTYKRYAKNVFSVLGAYANPTYLLASNDDAKKSSLRIYGVVSMEVLATSIKTTYNSFKLTDSVDHLYDSRITKNDALAPTNPRINPLNSVVTQRVITGYLGFGPQLVYQQNNLLNLNLLFLAGRSVTGDENISTTPPLNNYDPKTATRKFYYLAKGVITEKVTKLNATIGVEVRGFYPNNTGIAAYLGFLISPADFFKK